MRSILEQTADANATGETLLHTAKAAVAAAPFAAGGNKQGDTSVKR